MLRKLSLDQTKIYEQTIATYEIAKMLVSFIKGREHYLSIGAEQGDVDTWDDLVIEDKKDHHIHIQIKRQNTDFSIDNCIRDSYTRRDRIGALRDLSPIDKSMKALADWIKNNPNEITTKVFQIELPTSEVKFKKGLTVRNFKEFIQVHYHPNTTTAQGLLDLSEREANVKKCFEWLTTWCNFDDWNHILQLLSVIKIKDSGLEVDIEARTEDLLREVFVNDELEVVRLLIKSYTNENTTFTGAVKPRALLLGLKKYLQPSVGSWTQYNKQAAKWSISGINDIETNTKIERPSMVVSKVWENEYLQNLKINVNINGTCKVTDSLFRMVAHQTGSSNAHCQNKEDIKNSIKNNIGGTLGISLDDVQNMSIIENSEFYESSDSRQLANRTEGECCSDELEKAMYLETWSRVSILLEKIINEMLNQTSTTLRDNIEERWESWKEQLNENHEAVGDLFKSMVHPTAEGEDIKGEYRVGPKTAQHLADSLYLLLIISVSLDPENAGDWQTVSNKYNFISIGLEYWSGVAGQKRRVRNIDEDGDVIVGRESANVIIFSKVKSSPNDMLEDLISDSNDQGSNNIADGKTPDLIITNSIRFRKLIDKGNIDKVKAYIESQLRDSEKINLTNIKEIIE